MSWREMGTGEFNVNKSIPFQTIMPYSFTCLKDWTPTFDQTDEGI